jgi:leucyl aminopeptidase (aminopeptidase T)
MLKSIAGGREAGLLKATLERAAKTTRRFAREGKINKADLPGYMANIRNLGELGIGLNEKCRIMGNMLEDEKVLKTCHIAIGSNYDDDARALIHLDGLVKNPTIDLSFKGGRTRRILDKGKLLI